MARIGSVVMAAVVAGLLLAPTAPAATTVGDSSVPVVDCGGNTRMTQVSTGSGPGYVILSDGVITSFTAQSDFAGVQTKLLVLEGSGGTFSAVAKSDFGTFDAPGTQTFPTSLPARGGQRIGLFGHVCVAPPMSPGDVPGLAANEPEPPLGIPLPYFTGPPSRLSVSAQLEPDGDGDGFGDETQDRCLAEASPDGGPCGRTLTLDANKNKVKRGKKVSLSGHLDSAEQACESGQGVELQRKRPKQTTFTTLAQLQTDAADSFSAREKVKKTFEYRAQVAETATCGGGLSNTEKVKVKKK